MKKKFVFFLILISLSVYAHEEAEGLPQIIAFLGAKRVGKDTCADYLVRTHGYEKYALADPMKKAVQSLFHFTDAQLWGDEKEIVDPYWGVTPREVMQFIGIDTLFLEMGNRFPQIGHSFHVRVFEKWHEGNPDARVVVCDLRMQEDLDKLKEMGALVIRLERPSLVNSDTHISESHVDKVTGYDMTILNDDTIEKLEQKIEKAIHGN